MVFVKKSLALLLISFVFFTACRKSFNTDWDTDIVAPIARSHLNFTNLFKDSIFQADQTGLLHLAFSKKIAGFNLDSLIEIPDTTIVNNYPLIANFTVTPGQNLPTFPQTQDIDFKIANGAEVKRAIIHKGAIKVVYTNSFTQPLEFDLTLPKAIRNGAAFNIHEIIQPGLSSLVKYYDIGGFDLSLTGSSGNKSNTMPQIININVPTSAQSDVTQAGQKVQADVSYSDLIPYYLEGYFGQQTIVIPYDSLALNISNNLQAGNFQINSAYINFKIVNEFGVDVNAQLNTIKSVNTYSQTSVLLNAPALSNLNINRAGKTNSMSNPVFPSVKSVSVNTGNSNLKPFLENLPDYLTYSGVINVSPFGNISGSNDFAFYNTGINIYADVDLPLQIKADYFKLISNASIDLTSIDLIDNINYGNIVLQVTNGFPFEAVLQGYIMDEQSNVIDSLFITPGNIVKRGLLDASHKVTQPVFSKILIPVNQTNIANLKRCKSIKFVSVFLMPQPQPPDIKIYDTYTMDIVLSVDLNYKIKTN